MQKRLIATIGLPGSGKSTWAVEEQARLGAQGIPTRISNKDEIRKGLAVGGWVWSQEAEKDVIKAQNDLIKNAFNAGTAVVIVADTNFGKHKDRLRGLAFHCDAEFEIKDFTNIPLATCIERDAKRPEGLRVGEKVITEMYNKYLANVPPVVKPYIPDTRKPKAIICDLDGTLALSNGRRSPYDYSQVGQDDLNDPIAELVRGYAGYKGYTILYLSGREDSCRYLTEDWLQRNHMPCDPPHILLMRSSKDHRKDFIIKTELFDRYIRENYNVRFCLDDRDQVVKAWRDMGLTCLQVAYGNF